MSMCVCFLGSAWLHTWESFYHNLLFPCVNTNINIKMNICCQALIVSASCLHRGHGSENSRTESNISVNICGFLTCRCAETKSGESFVLGMK